MSDQSVPTNGQLPGLATRPPAGLEPIQLEQLAPGFGRRRPLPGVGEDAPAAAEPAAQPPAQGAEPDGAAIAAQYEEQAAAAVHEPAQPAQGSAGPGTAQPAHPANEPQVPPGVTVGQAPPPVEAQTPAWSPPPRRPADPGLAFGGGSPPVAVEPPPPQQPPSQQPPAGPAPVQAAPPNTAGMQAAPPSTPPQQSSWEGLPAPVQVQGEPPFAAGEEKTSPEIPSQRPASPIAGEPGAVRLDSQNGLGQVATERALETGVPAALAVDLCRLAVRHDVSLADLRAALDKLG